MNAYEEKQEARKERYEARADKARKESVQHEAASSRLVANIPFGQPILVGHHSEGAHRRTIERSQNLMFKMVDDYKKADYYEQKASSVGKGGISSDDPEAVRKIKEELVTLEAKQTHMKQINTVHKAYKKQGLSALEGINDSDKKRIIDYTPCYSWEPHPFAPFEMTNNNANIRRLKKRIEELTARAGDATSEQMINNVRIVDNVEDNRLQLFFEGKPGEEVRKKLKAAGFHWSPYAGAWQRQRSNAANYHAQEIVKGLS